MNIIWKYFRICILFSLFFVHWNLWYLNLKKEESLTGAYIANQNIHRNANLTKSNMQYTLFNTVKYMCWTLCNKVIILYNPYKILIFLLNKSIKDFFENFDQITLIFVEVVRRKTKPNVTCYFARYLCKSNYKYLIELDLRKISY